eukprot:3581772-Amphidinium_carterae.1
MTSAARVQRADKGKLLSKELMEVQSRLCCAARGSTGDLVLPMTSTTICSQTHQKSRNQRCNTQRIMLEVSCCIRSRR